MRIRNFYLGGTCLVVALLTGLASAARADDALDKAAADPNGWAMYGHGYDNTRYSPLKQITPQNVGQMKLAHPLQPGSLRSNESSPIVTGGTMYASTSWEPEYVYTLDAATGQRKWTYKPEIPDDVLQYACCDVNSRGVSFADGKIFVGRLDGKLAALDAETGKEFWVADVVDYKQGSVITSPPLVVKDLVITGFGGGEYSARGSLQAYNVKTGKQVWKTFTVPGPEDDNIDTWKGDSWNHGGGAPWLVGSYDPKTNTVFWGVKTNLPFNGGTLTTAGGLTFWDDLHGEFHAYDAKSYGELWHTQLGSGTGAGPISYSVNGKQYVAVVVGRTAAIPAFLGEVEKKMTAATPQGGALFVFTE